MTVAGWSLVKEARHASRTITRNLETTRSYTCQVHRINPIERPSGLRSKYLGRLDPSNISCQRRAASNTKESIAPQTHYEFFPHTLGARAMPPSGSFAVDLKALKKEFLQIQAKVHPDMAPADRKRQAEGLSARINEAYKTLQNPLLRAQYLLSLRGVDVAEDETARVEDPELLMEVLETRETIEDAQEEKDLIPLKEMNEARIADSVAVLDDAFKSDDIDLAKSESVKLRYWVNIRESIDAWEQGKPVVLIH